MNKIIFSPRVNELLRSPLRLYLDLNGTWDFTLDPEKQGDPIRYTEGDMEFDDTIQVPGCLEAQGKGLTYGVITPPAWSGTCDYPYLGISWYRKCFLVAEVMKDKNLMLNFGGISTDCKIWLNGRFLYEHHMESVGFGIDVTNYIKTGSENVLVIQVENRNTYEMNADRAWSKHSRGFGTSILETRWSGIYRGVELTAMEESHLSDIFIKPNAKKCNITLEYELSKIADELELSVAATQGETTYCIRSAVNGHKGIVTLDMPGAILWSDEEPVLYDCTVTLSRHGKPIDSLIQRFGLRDIEFDGQHILLNGIPVYLRGDMVHFQWPDSIAPNTDRDTLREKLSVYKAYGMNFLRHHTFCSHPEYLDVCDELGLLCHNELGIISYTFSIDESTAPDIWKASIRAGRNHPSLIIWSLGNESVYTSTCEDIPNKEQMDFYGPMTFELDDTRLLQDSSPGFFHFPDGRPKQKAPIHHELRRCGASYIDPSVKRHYTGALRPWRVLWAEASTKKAGIDHLLPLFVRNTQYLQAITRKLVLEDIRRNIDWPAYEFYHIPMVHQGYVLCTFRDSGSFMWGVVDDYFEPKIVSGEEFRHYNDATVLLWDMKWMKRMLLLDGSHNFITVAVSCSHYGKKAIQNGKLRWYILDSHSQIYAEQTYSNISVMQGETTLLCDERIYFSKRERPSKMMLKTVLGTEDGTEFTNSWFFWVFPDNRLLQSQIPFYDNRLDWMLKLWVRQNYSFIKPVADERDLPADSILLTSEVGESLLSHLQKGGRALLSGQNCFSGEVTEWGAGRSEYSRGTIIDEEHPLGKVIPNEGFCDIPFAQMISGEHELSGTRRNDYGCAIGLADWPRELKPIIAGIPSYKSSNPQLLAHMMEVKVGSGKLLITTLNFYSEGSNPNPASSYFFDQVLRYLVSDNFNPIIRITAELLREKSAYLNVELEKVKF